MDKYTDDKQRFLFDVKSFVDAHEIVDCYSDEVYDKFVSETSIECSKWRFGRALSTLGYKSVLVRVDGVQCRVIKEK